MMEQWQSAEDRNILDAWTNGGTYNGKPVTDKMITAYYRKRRNSYDKDEPEYTEWDNDLWQLRFQISNEGVMMRYKNGQIGAAAVAQHYRNWAQKMPKNSSYYRNMMATAGDFAKAAKAGSAGGGSAFDYQAMMKRINALDQDIAATETFYGGLTAYAVAHGFLLPGESITDPNALTVFEARDLQALLDAHVTNDPDWAGIQKGIQQIYPDFKGNITWDRIKRLDDVAIAARKKKIAEYRKAPYDMSSYIRSEQQAIRDTRRTSLFARQLDIEADLATSYDIWSGAGSMDIASRKGEEGRAGALDPEDFLSGDGTFVQDLERSHKRLLRAGLLQEAAYVQAVIWAVEGTKEGVQNLTTFEGASTMFGTTLTPDQLLSLGQETLAANNALELIDNGNAVIRFTSQPSEVGAALGEPWSMKFKVEELPVNPETGLPGVSGRQDIIIPHRMASGKWVGSIYTGKPVVGLNQEVMGYVWQVGGRKIYGGPDPAQPGAYRYVSHNPWENPEFGMTLTDKGNTFQVTVDAAQMAEASNPGVITPKWGDDPSEVYESLVEKIGSVKGTEGALSATQETRLMDAVVNQDWQRILTDPVAKEAWVKAHAEDFPQVWPGNENSAQANDALLAQSLRVRAGAVIPYTSEQAIYLRPDGSPRVGNEAETMGLTTNGVPNEAALQSVVAQFTQAAGAPPASPATVVAQNDPAARAALGGNLQQASEYVAATNFDNMGYNNPAFLVFNTTPDELKGGAEASAEFVNVAMQNSTSQQDINASSDDLAATYTVSGLLPIFDSMKKSGMSPDTQGAGVLYGATDEFAKRQADVAGISDYKPYVEPQVEQQMANNIWRGSSLDKPWSLFPNSEPRADQILPIAMADRAPTQGPPQPDVKIAGGMPGVSSVPNIKPNVNIKTPSLSQMQMPRIQSVADISTVRIAPLSAVPPANIGSIPNIGYNPLSSIAAPRAPAPTYNPNASIGGAGYLGSK
jgi:hypothetical protein